MDIGSSSGARSDNPDTHVGSHRLWPRSVLRPQDSSYTAPRRGQRVSYNKGDLTHNKGVPNINQVIKWFYGLETSLRFFQTASALWNMQLNTENTLFFEHAVFTSFLDLDQEIQTGQFY